jgi:hypothetical protein
VPCRMAQAAEATMPTQTLGPASTNYLADVILQLSEPRRVEDWAARPGTCCRWIDARLVTFADSQDVL